MALNFNSLKSILDEQEEERKKKGAAAKPSSSSKNQSSKTTQSGKKTTSQTGRQQSTAKLHSDDVKLNYSVADELKKRRKTTQPASTKKQSGHTVASIDKKIDEEKASARKRAWSYGQSASGDLALKKSGQRVKELDEEKKTAVDYEPSVIDQHGLLGGLGYAAETSLAGGLQFIDDAARNTYAVANRLAGMVTGGFGTNPNKVSDAFNRQAELVLGSSLAEDYKRNIEERYRPNKDDKKAGQLTEAAGAMLIPAGLSTKLGNPNIGLAAMGLSSMGGSATEGYAKTGEADTALAYGALAGAVETATEKMFAGIPGLNVSGLDEVADKVIKKMVKEPATSTLIKGAMDSLGEGFEEVVSTAVNPFLQRLTVDPDASISTKEELLEAGINGALLSALMQGGNLIAGKAVDATSRNTQKPATRSAEDMIREMLNMPRQTAREEVNGGERDLQGYTPEMQRTIQEYQASTDPGLVAFAEIIRRLPDKNSSNRMNYALSPVSERAVYDIKNATGIDVSGYQNNIKGNAIEHIVKRHGEAGQQDNSMQNIEDIGRIQYILDHYDSVDLLRDSNGNPVNSKEFRHTTGQHSPMVQFRKRIDGTYFLVEAVPDSKAKKLQVVTAYIQPNKKGAGQVLNMSESDPQLTSKTLVTSAPSLASTQVPDANAPGSTANTELANTPLQSGALQMYKPLDNVQDGRTDTVSKEAGQALDVSGETPRITPKSDLVSASLVVRLSGPDASVGVPANASPTSPISTPSLPQGETGVNSSIVGPGQNNTSQTAAMSDAERQVREMLGLLPNPSENGLNGVNNAAYSKENTSNSADEQANNNYVANNAYSQDMPGKATLQDVQAVAEELGISGLSESDLQRILGIYDSSRSDEPADQQFLEDLKKATGVKVRIDDITNNNGTEGQYSIRTLPDGSKMTVIDTGQDVFKGVAPKDYPKVAKRVIMENFVGKNLPVGEYDLADIRQRTAREYVYPKTPLAKDEWQAKLKAATELDNLLVASTYLSTGRDDGRHDFAEHGWDYYRTVFQIDGQTFEGLINVGRNADGSTVYDITKIKRLADITDKQDARLAPSASAFGKSSSDDSVSQKESTVNTSISNLAQRDTAGKILTAGEGMYDPVSDTIVFAPGSSRAQVVRGIALHELTHALQRVDKNGKRTKEYQALESFILQQLDSDLQQQILTKQTQYLQHGLALTEQGAKDELVAEYVRNKLFNDPRAIRRLVNEQRNVAQRIYDWLVDSINRLRGTLGNSDLAELYRGRDLFQSALEGRVQGEGSGQKQFSFEGTTEDGIRVYKSDFPDEISMSERIATFKDRIATIFNLGGVELSADGKHIKVLGDKFTAQKNLFGDKKGTSIEKKSKVNALYDLADILQTSSYKGKAKEASYQSPQLQGSVPKAKNAAHKNVKYWYKFTNTIIFDGIPFDVTFNIRDLGEQQYQYLIDFKQKKDYGLSTTAGDANLLRADHNPFLGSSVPQRDTGVNTSISQDQQTDTNKKQYSLSDQQTQAILEALDARMRQRGMARNSIPKAVEVGVPGMEEVQQGLAAESQVYQPERMAETQQKALDLIREKGSPEDAYGSLMDKTYYDRGLNSTETAAAVELIKHFAQNGDRERAVAMTQRLMETATEMGRAINALKLLQKYSPEGFLSFADRYLEHASKKKIPLTKQDKADLSALGQLVQDWPELARLAPNQRDSRIQETLREASAKLEEWVDTALHTKGVNMEDALTGKAMDLIANKAPASWRQKFRALQRISMLSNPKTHVRNVVGNAVVTVGETLAHPISWLADTALSKMTGQRTHAAISGREVLKGISDGINKANAQRRLGINLDGSQRYQEGGYLQPKAFNPELAQNPLSKGAATFLNWADNLVSTALNYGDAGFFQGYYQDALGQMMRANHVTEPTAEMMEAAVESALRRVFQDDNAVTESMQKLRNAVPYIGEIVAPYVKTPSNVVKIGIEYSPIGIAEGMMKAFVGENSIRRLQQQGVDTLSLQRQCAELIGRGAIGSALMVLGMALGKAGIGTGDEEEDQNRYQFNRTIGAIPNSFKIGDTYFDLSSLQSAGVPLLAGSAIGSAWRDQQQNTDAKWLDYFRGLLSGTVKAGNTATEMPMVQGISEVLGGDYEQQGTGESLTKIALTGASQILPFGSLGRQIANAIDPYSRDRFSDKMLEQELINPVKAQIPGLADDFPIRYDTLGNPQQAYEGNSTAERLFNVFLNPLNTAKDKSTPVTDEIQRLFAESQDKSVFPARAPYDTSYESTSYDFTTQQRQDWQAEQGQTLNQLLSSLFQSDSYRRATASQQVEMIGKAKDYAYAKAKDAFLEGQGISYEDNTVKKYQDAMDAGLSTTEYLAGAVATSGSENSDLQKVENILAIPGLSNAEKVRCAVFFTDNSRPSRYLKEALDRGLGDEYLEAYDACSGFDAKNDKGVSVTNLKKQRVFDYIQNLPWSAKDKLWFFTEVFGYKPY